MRHSDLSLLAAALIGLTALLLASAPLRADKIATFTVSAGKTDRANTPVCADLTGVKLPAKWALIRALGPKAPLSIVPAQLEGGPAPKLWWILRDTIPAGKTRTYHLTDNASPAFKDAVVVKQDEKKLLVQQNATKIFQYNIQAPPAPKGVDKVFERTGYIHPMWSLPTGDKQRVITCDFPSDHYHHHGIWFPWTNTTFLGRHVDFWNLRSKQGTVRLRKVVSTTNGPVWGGFVAEHEFVAFPPPPSKKKPPKGKVLPPAWKAEKIALTETWDVRIFCTGGPAARQWLWQVTSTQRCAGKDPLTINKYRYGGMGYRPPLAWKGDNGLHLTSEGKDRAKSDNTRPRWTVISGAIGGQWDSVTLMSHPANINHPEPVRTWSNVNGPPFCGFAPVRASGWVFEPGKEYVFRYRFHVAGGKPDANVAERAWQDFANPPKVSTTK